MAKEIELIKEKLDLVEFLRSYLTLLPAGRNFKALCPFHQEKTPSFIVSPDRQMWHCFGACAEGGDIFKFVMKYENLEFYEALKFLAEKAGVTLQTLSPERQREFGILYDIHEAAKGFFREEFVKNREAREYLCSRGLRAETIEEFELGFAPGGESLTLHLLHLGYDIQDIVRSGLSRKNVQGLYRDHFAGRVIFPIVNAVGKTVAFTGRILPAYAREDLPKYLNSPETSIFSKSKILYGFHKAKNAIAETRTAFFVEGQMDFLMSWQAGIANVVAVSGTGVSEYYLDRLRRLADTVIVSFDNDAAGIKALEHSLDVLTKFDFHVKAVTMEPYKDPAEAVQREPTFLSARIQGAGGAFSLLFRSYFSKPLDFVAKKRAISHALSKIKLLKSAVEESAWLKELARFSGVSESALQTELLYMPKEKRSWEGTGTAVNAVAPSAPQVERIDLIARRLLVLAFTHNDFLETLKARQTILPAVFQPVLSSAGSELVEKFQMEASYELGRQTKDELHSEFQELLRQLEIESLKREQLRLKEQLRAAEVSSNEVEIGHRLSQIHSVAKKINELKAR